MTKKLSIRMNGFNAGDLNAEQTLACIFKNIPNLNIWSYDALKILYVESVKMVVELFYDKKKNIRSSSQFSKLIKYCPKNRDKLLNSIYNILLNDEGLSLLRGFGVSNIFGDKLKGNPEYQSILK